MLRKGEGCLFYACLVQYRMHFLYIEATVSVVVVLSWYSIMIWYEPFTTILFLNVCTLEMTRVGNIIL